MQKKQDEIRANVPLTSEQINRIFLKLVVGIFAIVAGYAALVVFFAAGPRVTLGQTGTFGDSFGILTSLFSGLAFAGLIWTIMQQRLELRLQRSQMEEARRQDVITRLCMVVQNQVAGYRSEIESLTFTSSPFGQVVGFRQMIFELDTRLSRLVTDRELGKLTDEDHDGRVLSEIELVEKDLHQHLVMIQGLERCCKNTRYLLTNELLNVGDAVDLSALLRAEMPPGLFEYTRRVRQLLVVHEQINKLGPDMTLLKALNPMRPLRIAANRVVDFDDLNFTEDSIRDLRATRWMYRP
ncbi:hypothetical protein [Polaromonas sp.]|uniref:hypothetical protein n=1 Tax=Polaromonas sp. TaxID=1869339 RepID=UPI002488CFD4|nr:hypothetical protein [Polaromonas sp.]MDI1339365.1 hypothetical protein [Polaromonas sp.]